MSRCGALPPVVNLLPATKRLRLVAFFAPRRNAWARPRGLQRSCRPLSRREAASVLSGLTGFSDARARRSR